MVVVVVVVVIVVVVCVRTRKRMCMRTCVRVCGEARDGDWLRLRQCGNAHITRPTAGLELP